MINTTHPLYSTWLGMRQRCNNLNAPSYHNYGGRGITICDSWSSFEAFVADMGDRPDGFTLERLDNNLGYTPDNCVWADHKTQACNRRPRRMNVSFNPNTCVRTTPDGYRVSICLRRGSQHHKHFPDLLNARLYRDECLYEREFQRRLGL